MDNRTVLLLRVPQEATKKEIAAEQFFSQLSEIIKGQPFSLSVEIAILNKFIWFFITCPAEVKDVVRGQWYSQYGNAEIEEIKDYIPELLSKTKWGGISGTELYLDKSDFTPLLTYKELQNNCLTAFAGLATSLSKDDAGLLQIVLIPPKKDNIFLKLDKKRREAYRLRVQQKNTEELTYLQLETDKEEKPYFTCSIRIVGLSNTKTKADMTVAAIGAVFKKTLERPKLQKLKEKPLTSEDELLRKYEKRLSGKKQFRLASDELATFFHLPYQEEGIAQVVQQRTKRAPAPQNIPTPQTVPDKEIAVFGQASFQNEHTVFGMKTVDRRRHVYVIGKTGVGKSKLLELFIKSDLEHNRGIIVLDPHGDLCKEILHMVPQHRINDVVYFNPVDTDYPIGFNPMEGVGSFEFRQNIVAGFVSIFKKLFGLNWNERFEHVLRYTTLALLEYPQASILGIPRMLTDNLFRQEVIGYITDPLVKKFWTVEFSAWNDAFAREAIVPIINKIGQFVANPMIRNIVGQSKSGFDLASIMNGEKILIANLSMGQLGEENSALLGSILVTKIWQAALSRSATQEDQRKDTFFYVDEFQNFATSSFVNILSEARKYRLNLTVAHQYMQQLTEELRSTIFGNVSNIISFRVGGDDAQLLTKEFEPTFNVNDFLNLDIRNFYIKMSVDGQTTNPFSGNTLDVVKPQTDFADEIIASSRKQWAKTKKDAEAEIAMWEKGAIVSEAPKPKAEFYPEPIV